MTKQQLADLKTVEYIRRLTDIFDMRNEQWKLVKAAKMLRGKYKRSEHSLYVKICKKYHVKSEREFFPVPFRKQPPLPITKDRIVFNYVRNISETAEEAGPSPTDLLTTTQSLDSLVDMNCLQGDFEMKDERRLSAQSDVSSFADTVASYRSWSLSSPGSAKGPWVLTKKQLEDFKTSEYIRRMLDIYDEREQPWKLIPALKLLLGKYKSKEHLLYVKMCEKYSVKAEPEFYPDHPKSPYFASSDEKPVPSSERSVSLSSLCRCLPDISSAETPKKAHVSR